MTDSRKIGKIMIISGIIILIVFIVFLFISSKKNNSTISDELNKFKNPFGLLRPAKPRDNQTIPVAPQNLTDTIEETITIKPQDPLLQLTNFAVTDYKLIPASPQEGGYILLLNDKELGYIYSITGNSEPKRIQLSTTVIQDSGEFTFGSNREVFARYYNEDELRYEGFFGRLQDKLDSVSCSVKKRDTLTLGATNGEVELVQYYLTKLLNTTIEYKPGTYDEGTSLLVKNFQAKAKITTRTPGLFDDITFTAFQKVCREYERFLKAQELSTTNTPRYTTEGRPEAGELLDITTNPNGTSLFYIKTTLDGIKGYIRNLATGSSSDKQVYNLPFIEWNISWPTNNIIAFTTKAAKGIGGYTYFLNTITNDFKKVITGTSGYTALVAPDGKTVLTGESTSVGYAISLQVLDEKSQTKKQSVNLSTFPEKCTFNKSSTKLYCMAPETLPESDYPDRWYQSLVRLTDELWSINTATGRRVLIDTFSRDETPRNFDSVNLKIDDNEKFLYFIDQKTGFLWRYDLKLKSS